MRHITVDICTKGRYGTTLPLTLSSVINQTRTPDAIILYDDNAFQCDLREIPTYKYLFEICITKGIECKVLYGDKKGQVMGHQKIQSMAKDLVWRIDDDEIAEPNCLEVLEESMVDDVIAVGGLVIEPNAKNINGDDSNYALSIDDIKNKSNIQWYKQPGRIIKVDHLYSSFLYEACKQDYNIRLSPVGHREETMFSNSLSRIKNVIVNTKAVTWHLRNPEGGIREASNSQMFEHDESIFDLYMRHKNKKIAVLNNGMGDHIVFLKLLPTLDIDLIACCYNDVFKDSGKEIISIDEAAYFVNIERYNLYSLMSKSKEKLTLEEAYLKLYGHNNTKNS